MVYGKTTVFVGNTTDDAVNVSRAAITDTTVLETMGLGLESRLRRANYPEIVRVGSVYAQSNSITTTERSIGLPAGAPGNFFFHPTVASAFQISSSSAADTSAGTGARTCSITGLTNIAGVWTEITETLTMNGLTAVSTTSTDFWRVNKIWVDTSGSGNKNAGDIYICAVGQSITAGVPDANVIAAIILGYSNSTSGCYSVASGRGFQYTKGNFYIDQSKNMVIHERFRQDFSGGDDLTEYEVGEYPVGSTSYDYTGAAPYTEKTDILLSCYTTTGSASRLTYYVEYVLTDASATNP